MRDGRRGEVKEEAPPALGDIRCGGHPASMSRLPRLLALAIAQLLSGQHTSSTPAANSCVQVDMALPAQACIRFIVGDHPGARRVIGHVGEKVADHLGRR